MCDKAAEFLGLEKHTLSVGISNGFEKRSDHSLFVPYLYKFIVPWLLLFTFKIRKEWFSPLMCNLVSGGLGELFQVSVAMEPAAWQGVSSSLQTFWWHHILFGGRLLHSVSKPGIKGEVSIPVHLFRAAGNCLIAMAFFFFPFFFGHVCFACLNNKICFPRSPRSYI